jgi:hypothetical protein
LNGRGARATNAAQERHTQTALAERFLAHMLARNIRVEEDLVDQLFNKSEKRLARVLLLLARYGESEAAAGSQDVAGATVSNVSWGQGVVSGAV